MTTAPFIEPTIVQRSAQPYVGLTRSVPMSGLDQVADRIPEIFRWLGARGLAPAGPPFFRYEVIDMAREMVVEAGVPVGRAVTGDGEVQARVLPAGRYVTVTHVGHPKDLGAVTAALLDWAAGRGLVWDRSESPEGERWASRLEFYHTDPAEEPDMNKWTTELAFRLAD